jgi:uncharacterized lipoprotein YmbA
MTTALRLALLAVAAAAAAGCSTPPPVHYHTLLAPAAAPAAMAAPAAVRPPGFVIDVLAVGVPPQLDQPQLRVRQADGGVALLENERWAGPLPDELRSALSAQLTRLLGTQDIAGLPATTGGQVLRIKLQLRRLDAWPSARVQLEADWSMAFTGEGNGPRLTCGGRFETAAAGGYPALVLAQQQALAALAERMAADARRWAAARTAGCQGEAPAPQGGG